MNSNANAIASRAAATISVALLSGTSLLAQPSAVQRYATVVLKRAHASPAAAVAGSRALEVLEKYCQGDQCVALPKTQAEWVELDGLAKAGLVELEELPDAAKVYFARATYDSVTGEFDRDFPGRAEIDERSAMGQWTMVLKAFLDPSWRQDFANAGFILGEAVGPMAYQLYGPRDAVGTLMNGARYIASLSPVPFGIKRRGVDDRREGDEAGAPAPTTVVLFPIDDAQALKLLSQKEGRLPSVAYHTGATIAYDVLLTSDEAVYLSTFAEVISVERRASMAAPSDERSNAIIAGNFQSSDTSWPLQLAANTTPPVWTGYLSYLSSLGISPANQTIAFLDTGLNSGPLQSCPPALTNPATGTCSLDLGVGVRSISDITTEFDLPARRANDYLGHGTFTTAIAVGFAPASGARDSQQYSLVQGVAPGAKIAMSKMVEYLACTPSGTSFRRFLLEPGGGYMYQDDLKLRYSLVTMSRPTNYTAPDGVRGAGATLFNHSWNVQNTIDYGTLDIRMDQSARRLSAVQFNFGTPETGANIVSGANAPATHVVSAGNTSAPSSGEPTDENLMVTTPGTAKNVITIGATETYNQLSYPSYPAPCRAGGLTDVDNPRQISVLSRRGYPNFRLKPDFVAPGNRIYGPESALWASGCAYAINCNALIQSGTPSYYAVSGTSFAAPAVTGVVALLREWFRILGRPEPSPAMARALLVAGAQNLVAYRLAWGVCCNTAGQCWSCDDMRPAPDQAQGWGGVSLDRYFRTSSNYYFADQTQVLTQGQAWSQTLTIADPTKPIRIALTWTDRAAGVTTHTLQNLQNDLDVRVRSTGSDGIQRTWYGNLSYLNRDELTRREWSLRDPSPITYDRKNNQEKVAIAPLGQSNGLVAGMTTITVTVTAWGLAGDGLDPDGSTLRQDFALAVENAHQ